MQDNTEKRALGLQYSDSHTSAIADENLSPPKKYTIQTKLSTDNRKDSVAGDAICSLASSPPRPPLNL
jgi:hypothetical protein